MSACAWRGKSYSIPNVQVAVFTTLGIPSHMDYSEPPGLIYYTSVHNNCAQVSLLQSSNDDILSHACKTRL